MLTSSDIRALLFGDSQHLIKITELIEYLRTILDNSEHKVYYAQRDLELQNHCIIRICQLLKGAVRSKSGSPYYYFLHQCLRKTRDTGVTREKLLSKMRKSHRFFLETNKDMFSPIGNLVHVGGASGASRSGASMNVGNGGGVSGAIRGVA